MAVPALANQPQGYAPTGIAGIIVVAVGIHAVVAGNQHSIASLGPAGQPAGQQAVGPAGCRAVFAAICAIQMPGIVNTHAVHQQKVRAVQPLQAGSIVKDLVVWVGIGAIKMAVGNGQGGGVRMPVAGGLKGLAVAQFAHPVVGRCGGYPARSLNTAENMGLWAGAGAVIVGNAAFYRALAAQQGSVDGARKGRQLCVEFCVAGLARIYQRLHVAHAGAGSGGGKTIEQHKNYGGHYQSPLPAGRGPKSRPGA